MSFRESHSAQCSNCNYTERTRESGAFIRAFFLPGMCENCGEGMSSGYNRYGGNDRPHWRHVIVKEELHPSTRNLFRIRTWLSGATWKEIERCDMRA